MIGGDAFYYSFPLRNEAWNIIRQGYFPLWTTNLFGGYPLFSMAQLGLAYPLTWGYFVLPPHWAEQIYIALPFLLASIFTFLYARQIGLSAEASMLAGLSFAYGGFFMPTLIGFLTNGVMWLPLILIAIERSKTARLAPWLLLSTFCYTMSVLNGHGQSFVYVGVLAITYSIATTIFVSRDQSLAVRLRPLVVGVGGILFATGLSSFQTFETLAVVPLSLRRTLDYTTFSEGSLSVAVLGKSFLSPRFNLVDVATYIPLLGAFLALYSLTQIRKNALIGFWLIIAVAAFILMLGSNTPLYQFVHKLPFINLFRVPARHSFEWTFALSVLSGFGLDAATNTFKKRSSTTLTILTCCLLVLAVVLGIYWTHYSSEAGYIISKLVFTSVLLVAAWMTFRLLKPRLAVTCALIVIACFFEAFIIFDHLWLTNRRQVGTQQFLSPAPATRFIQQLPANDGRVYTDGPHISDNFDSFDLLPYFGLSGIAGYEPLMLTRFSEAMGNVSLNTSELRKGLKSDGSLLEPDSHVLDLLHTKYVTTFWDLGDKQDESQKRDGITFIATASPIRLKSRESASFTVSEANADVLGVVSSLAYASSLVQGERVAIVRLQSLSGTIHERELVAGVHTAEWAHERADLREVIPHQLPPVFDSVPGDDRNSFQAKRYLAKVDISDREPLKRVSIENVSGVELLLWKLTLFDSASQTSFPISLLGPDRWETLYNKNRVVVLRNRRALPRAWLVSDVRHVTAEEALCAIRGHADFKFDPSRTALVETPLRNLSGFTGQALTDSSVQVVREEPNRLTLDADVEAAALLVVSEIYYPGWVAEVDGQPADIQQTNYLLRGVFLDPGKHRIVMRYTAPAAKQGLLVSLFSLITLCVLLVFLSRRRQTNS